MTEKTTGRKYSAGAKLRQEREGADNTLRRRRSKVRLTESGVDAVRKSADAAGKPMDAAGKYIDDATRFSADGLNQSAETAGAKKRQQRRLIHAEARRPKSRLRFADPEGQKSFGTGKSAISEKPRKPGTAAGAVISGRLHQAVNSSNEDQNTGVQAAQFTEGTAEGTVRAAGHASYSHKLRKYSRAKKLEAGTDAENIEKMFGESLKDNPGAASNPFSRWRQRQQIKKKYAAMKAGKTMQGSGAAATGAQKAAEGARSVMNRMLQYVKSHSHVILLVACAGLLIMVVAGSVSSCSMMMNGMGNTVLGTSFTAEDEDLLGADEDYEELESDLREQLDSIESEHPGYDEYRYNLAEIGHNPYELAALLTVEYENYTRAQVQEELQRIFNEQYELTLEEEVEIRTRTETRTSTSTDPETGETTEDEYEVEVEYEYYILNVTLTNKGVDAVARESNLTDDQLERYEVLLETRGNRDDLFGDVSFAIPDSDYLDYDIPGEALTDEKFRNMINEAEKYLGYPYVWGGSSPSTSFDCSGFVSYVINHCGNGWNVGRQTANGLMNSCDIIPKSEAQPGDLIFFQKTYNTSGASHVGIYVGNGMMLHCGSPISYASIETSYWQQHYYCMGRIR